MNYKKDKMHILKHCETNEYIASKFKGYGKYELVSLNKLKENKIYFKENKKIKQLFSKSYHIHFRGGNTDIQSYKIITQKNKGNTTHSPEGLGLMRQSHVAKQHKIYDLKSIDPKDLFKPQNKA
ncbi:MAG: hypothetical protein H9Q67_06830 [Spiroplasma ixodetis]|nr:hypothetical protein [Spiroplasma ixodetis]